MRMDNRLTYRYIIAAVVHALIFCVPLLCAARSVWHDKPVNIDSGDYLLDSITPATQNFMAHTRIAIDPKTQSEWGMCWGDPDGDFITARIIIPPFRQHNDTYRDVEAMLQVERNEGGNTRIVSKKPLGAIVDTEGRSNSLKLFYDRESSHLLIYAGSEMQQLVGKSEVNVPCKVWYFVCQPSGLIGCGALSLDGTGVGIKKSSKFHDTDSLMDYLKASDDSKEGVWRYLDRNMNEKYAAMGGRYTIATVANDSGGYNIIYLSGADTNDTLWEPLSVKGTLAPTIFIGNFDMRWMDAEGKEYTDDTNAQYSADGSILTLSFPALNTQLRFSRLVLR